VERLGLAETCRATLIIAFVQWQCSDAARKHRELFSERAGGRSYRNEDVTTQELENEFRLVNVPPDKQKDPALVKQVLGELVLRKYLLQQALAAKLDREPSVLLDLLRAGPSIVECLSLSDGRRQTYKPSGHR